MRPYRRCSTAAAIAVLAATLAISSSVPTGPAAAAAGGSASAAGRDPGIKFVPDVDDQFAKLAVRPDGLGFGIGSSPEPEQCKHYQGMVRYHVPGAAPYLFVSRSGNEAGPGGAFCSDSDDPGNLLIVRMDSRPTTGERMRSNRLVRGSHGGPDSRDTTVAYLSFDGGDWPAYAHPGGMQLVGDVLAVPLETPYEDDPPNLVMFLDVSQPEHPRELSRFDAGTGSAFSAGVLGITPVLADGGRCCRYLMVMTGKENKEVRLYRSLPTPDREDGTSNLASASLDWALLRSFSETEIEDCLGGADWHTGKGDSHNTLNFVRESSLEGDLFLIGGRNSNPLPAGSDLVDLYAVGVDTRGNPGDCLLTLVDTVHLTSKPIIAGGDSANLAAAGGVYVSPSGELIVYSTEFENDGPPQFQPDGTLRRTVRFAEWRHREVVRRGSPTLRPTVDVGGPFEVDEGSSVTLTGSAQGPITKAWLQLFEDDGLGASVAGFGDSDDWLIADYDDWNSDDFDDFRELDYSDDAGSLRYFAPVGCTVRANDDDFGDGDFPGRFTRTLPGTGAIVEEPDLNRVTNDAGDLSMDDEITSMQFFGNCDDYYRAPIDVTWDLDADGDFETVGSQPAFSAAALDGPTSHVVAVRGKHPTDPTSLGVSPAKRTGVHVRNVPPQVASLRFADPLGREIGTEVPSVLPYSELAAVATFTDAGVADTQTATIDWGDGSVETSSDFDDFTGATGGVTGSLLQHHTYEAPGTYTVRLELLDDDGDATARTATIDVADPEDVVRDVIGAIDARIAAGGAPAALKPLTSARDHLDGRLGGSAEDGAIDKLEGGELTAALVKIEAAIEALKDAEEAGAGDLRLLKDLLVLVADSVAQAAYADAVVATAPPSETERRELEDIARALEAGRMSLRAGDHLAAMEDFEEALRRALALARP